MTTLNVEYVKQLVDNLRDTIVHLNRDARQLGIDGLCDNAANTLELLIHKIK